MKKINFIVLILLLGFSSTANAEINTEYLRASKNCKIGGRPSAFEVGERIAYGDPISNKFQVILTGDNISGGDVIEPIQISYALYVIAERIGDPRGALKQRWAEPYIGAAEKDQILSVIYRSYSVQYLRKCFSIEGAEQPAPKHIEPHNNEGQDADPEINTGKTINQNRNTQLYIWN